MSEVHSLDARRRRATFRAWHRGIKEMDLLLGRYADVHVPQMTAAELDAFEALMLIDDRDLIQWLTDEAEVPPDRDSRLLRAICAFHATERA